MLFAGQDDIMSIQYGPLDIKAHKVCNLGNIFNCEKWFVTIVHHWNETKSRAASLKVWLPNYHRIVVISQ